MSSDTIVRRTYKISNFTGDNYFSSDVFKKDFNATKSTVFKEKKNIKPKKNKSHLRRSISWEDHLLNQMFRRWLKDNMSELRDTFNVIINIHKQNKGVFLKPEDEIFKSYARMIFRRNKREIISEYSEF